MKIYLVKCPACGNNQKIATNKDHPKGIIKQCVFCPKKFNIHHNINKSQIISREK